MGIRKKNRLGRSETEGTNDKKTRQLDWLPNNKKSRIGLGKRRIDIRNNKSFYRKNGESSRMTEKHKKEFGKRL